MGCLGIWRALHCVVVRCGTCGIYLSYVLAPSFARTHSVYARTAEKPASAASFALCVRGPFGPAPAPAIQPGPGTRDLGALYTRYLTLLEVCASLHCALRYSPYRVLLSSRNSVCVIFHIVWSTECRV